MPHAVTKQLSNSKCTQGIPYKCKSLVSRRKTMPSPLSIFNGCRNSVRNVQKRLNCRPLVSYKGIIPCTKGAICSSVDTKRFRKASPSGLCESEETVNKNT